MSRVRRQLITRIAPELHERLKERARAEGRSLNSLVEDMLSAAMRKDTPAMRYKAKLAAEGRLVLPPRPERVPSWEEARALGRKLGPALLEALEEQRANR